MGRVERERRVVLEGGGWRSPPLRVAVGFTARRRGLRDGGPGGLMMWGRSVHGHGMAFPLLVVGLDPVGTVCHMRILPPGGLLVLASRGWIVELPPTTWPPPHGARLTACSMLAPCPAS